MGVYCIADDKPVLSR